MACQPGTVSMDVWVFNGEGSAFPSGVFSTRADAERWIALHSLSGTLTRYPVDTGIYDWAVGRGTFKADKPVTPTFIGRFSSAYQEHYHYDDGLRNGVG